MRNLHNRLVKRLVWTTLITGGGAGFYIEYQEFQTRLRQAYTINEDPDVTVSPWRYLLGYLTRNLGLKGTAQLSLFLQDMNSWDRTERRNAIEFVRNGALLKLLADHDDAEHLIGRIRRSRIIHAMARLNDPQLAQFFTLPSNPNLGAQLPHELLDIFHQLPSTELLSDRELFTPCVKYFTETAIAEMDQILNGNAESESKRDMLGDNLDMTITPIDQHEDAGILMLLKALRRYCESRDNYKRINLDQVFRVLIDILLNEHSPVPAKSLEMKQIALRCLANLAMDRYLHPKFLEHGIHALLREFSEEHQTHFDDNEICFNQLFCRFQAIRALLNLDADNDEEAKCDDGVYQLAPAGRVTEPLKYDLVFVHGLGGSAAGTWTTKTEVRQPNGTYTPKRVNWVDQWVARDMGNDPKNCRILVVDYETAIIFTGHQCPYQLESRKIHTIATDIGEKLKSAGVGQRPTIFVGYSMGGLLTKKMLELFPEFWTHLKGITFLATPHFGSPIAEIIDEKQFSYFATFVRKITTPEIIMLGGLEESLVKLNEGFVAKAKENNVPCMSWGEELPSNWGVDIHIVPPERANPGYGQFYTSKKDHDGMVMPMDEVDPIYSNTINFMRHCLKP